MSRVSSRVRDAAIVFVIAMFVRALFLYTTSDHGWPHSVLYEGDAPVWARWAQALNQGEAFEFDLPMRTPSIAYALHWLNPHDVAAPFTIAKLLWCAISALTCAMLYVVVASSVTTRAAWIAAGLLCFSFGAYELATSLNNEAPYAFVLVLLIGATLRWSQAPRAPLAIAIGILHGVALLLRAEHALLLVGFLLWSGFATRTAIGLRSMALIVVAAVAICLPWSWRSHVATKRFNEVETSAIDLRNAVPPWSAEAQAFLRRLPAFARDGNFRHVQYLAQASGKKRVERADLEEHFAKLFGYVPEPLSEWTLVCSKGALDFALANQPACDGGFSRAGLLDGTDPDPKFAFGRPSHLKLYNHGFAIGLASIRADFASWTRLVRKKLERFCAGVTLGWSAYDLPYGRASRRWPIDLATPLNANIFCRVACGLAILGGIVLGWRRNVGALCLIVIAYKLLVTVLFYGYARQAVSIAPVFYVFAAIAIDSALERLACPARLAKGLGVVIVLALVGCDVARSLSANQFDIRGVGADTRIERTPQWGSGAFESFGEIEILPR